MIIIRQNLHELFALGTVVATPGSISLLDELDVDANELISRHQAGDWGDVDEHDREVNFYVVDMFCASFAISSSLRQCQ